MKSTVNIVVKSMSYKFLIISQKHDLHCLTYIFLANFIAKLNLIL